MQAVFNVGEQRAFLMDMPKSIPKDKLGGLYAGIEKIKDGFAYDKRYNYRELRFMEPHVFVFTNKWPDLHLLSVDRWQLYYVMDNELVLFAACHCKQQQKLHGVCQGSTSIQCVIQCVVMAKKHSHE